MYATVSLWKENVLFEERFFFDYTARVYHMESFIRNFCIIAHIDHGKSTLADRLLECTGTVEKRKMKAQYLDQLELERERGITIKMAPVRMHYASQGKEWVLNLIDTPGHPDFGYEVSRALEAVEGAILLVDATQGIQAQTLSNLYAAQKAGLTVIGAVNKIDMASALPQQTVDDVARLLGVDKNTIHRVSGKTGEGVEKLLDDLIVRIPPPKKTTLEGIASKNIGGRALIFDSFYDDHKGVIAEVRVFNGKLSVDDSLSFVAARERLRAKEVGYFIPQQKSSTMLVEGDIGYVVTGLKDPHKIKIGDTVIHATGSQNLLPYALAGYREPKPVVFVSLYPDNPDEYDELKKSLEKLRLNDSSFSFEPDTNEVLGRGFKGGFLGKLHFEIIAQRLEREFQVKTITSFPSVAYKVRMPTKTLSAQKGRIEIDEEGLCVIKNAKDLSDDYETIYEPMIRVEIICPRELLGAVLGLKELFRWSNVTTSLLGEKNIITARMPLAELISDFDDRLKSISGGFASFNYNEDGFERADLSRMDILVAGESVSGLSRILPRQSIEREGKNLVSRLKDTLPRQQFSQAIQAKAFGRIIARETIPALRKDVTGYLYGGDRTRKMKLWKKQKEGKKKLLGMARVKISADDFKKLLAK